MVASEVSQQSNCKVIVDVGSGQGHLSRLLAYGYGMEVFCLESEDKLIDGARYVLFFYQ